MQPVGKWVSSLTQLLELNLLYVNNVVELQLRYEDVDVEIAIRLGSSKDIQTFP